MMVYSFIEDRGYVGIFDILFIIYFSRYLRCVEVS